MSKDAKLVAALHRDKVMSCSQAILLVYGKYFGLSEEMALKLASGFGGGMGHMGNTCGAVTGAFMVLGGLVYEIDNPNARNEIYNLIQEFTRRFISEHGSINCRDLLGCDISTQAGYDIIREKKLTTTICPKLDQFAAELIEDLAAEKLQSSCRTV